jgi:hypothetical protein
MLQIVPSLTDSSRGIIYNCNIFIVQATGHKIIYKTIRPQMYSNQKARGSQWLTPHPNPHQTPTQLSTTTITHPLNYHPTTTHSPSLHPHLPTSPPPHLPTHPCLEEHTYMSAHINLQKCMIDGTIQNCRN